MKVIVDGAAGTVTAEDTDTLNELSVVMRSADAELAGKVLENYGRVDGTHAWLDIEALKTFAPLPHSHTWDARFAKAMAYAASNGWTDETGRFVRAHLDEREA
ncbi:hypothetical protein QRX50_29705 [Amycolatopsis carbonis]|uniref:Uncharacterized protein n=1 Tax=Amycolatopsis carbonis TaxID=715471 RepID=A0A9Y2IBY1_9PSEU|nr:hypothetical protein [Amycolatopsis sp. 2-15]WIX75663.1 hypothetical protein QRX50_29705 [Amycolatopsis sp. 2-15]